MTKRNERKERTLKRRIIPALALPIVGEVGASFSFSFESFSGILSIRRLVIEVFSVKNKKSINDKIQTKNL